MTKPQDAPPVVVVNRREVLRLFPQAGAALVLGTWLGGCGFVEKRGRGWVPSIPPDAWLKINPDGMIDIVVARSEMGQGVRTALPAIVAEELEADWSSIRVLPALADRERYGSQTTGGSLSIRTSWATLRRVGATARAMLVAAAAEEWSVSPEECAAEAGQVIHPETGRRLSYAVLAEPASRQEVPRRVKVKPSSEFRLVGQPLKRLDTPAKARGEAKFGIDVRLPGMVFAALARSPRIGGKLVDFDATAAKQRPGVINVFEADGFVAVLARSTWAAFSARDALKLEWDEGPSAGLSSQSIRDRFEEQSRKPGVALHERGSIASELAASDRTLEAVYHCPFLAHTPMEPMNCTVAVRDDSCEIWVPTQVPNEVREMAARRTGLPLDRVTVHTTLLGGGFGRRLVIDYAEEAVAVAQKAERPVQVVWTREDDIQQGYFRPASFHRMTAGLDAEGGLSALHHTMVAPSILDQLGRLEHDYDTEIWSELTTLYGVPNLLVDYVQADTPIPVTWMRSVYNMDAAFAEEAFLDEVAVASGRDPVELRSGLLDAAQGMTVSPEPWNPGRLKAVLASAARHAGWGDSPSDMHQGIACHASYLSYAAAVVEVSTEREGLRIERIVVSVDCGRVVNPSILEAQIEGGVLFALSTVLNGEITFEGGAVQQSNFHDYPMLRIADAPPVEIHIIETANPPTGAGELPVPVVAPALANAVFAATGERLRNLPLRDLGLTNI